MALYHSQMRRHVINLVIICNVLDPGMAMDMELCITGLREDRSYPVLSYDEP